MRLTMPRQCDELLLTLNVSIRRRVSIRTSAKRALLVLFPKIMVLMLLMWPVPMRSFNAIFSKLPTSSCRTQGRRTTTSAPFFLRSRLVVAMKTATRGWLSLPFLFVVLFKEPPQLPSKVMSSMFHSSQLLMSLQPCRCPPLPPMQEQTSLLSQDR